MSRAFFGGRQNWIGNEMIPQPGVHRKFFVTVTQAPHASRSMGLINLMKTSCDVSQSILELLF